MKKTILSSILLFVFVSHSNASSLEDKSCLIERNAILSNPAGALAEVNQELLAVNDDDLDMLKVTSEDLKKLAKRYIEVAKKNELKAALAKSALNVQQIKHRINQLNVSDTDGLNVAALDEELNALNKALQSAQADLQEQENNFSCE